MSEKKIDRSISVIRLIAFSFIITCHIQQYLNINLAWWFNVGVQIFCAYQVTYMEEEIFQMI